MRRASPDGKKLSLVVLVLLLALVAFSRITPETNAQGSPTVTGVGPWSQQGNYGSSSTIPGQGGLGTLGASCVVYSAYVYCVGGQNPSGTDISDVFYAQLLSNGTIGPWTETIDYGAASGTTGSGGTGIEWPSCVESGGYIYCVAGATNSGISSKVYFAQLSSSGVGPWAESTDYGATAGSSGTGGLKVFQLACVTYNGYAYCVGGGAGSKVFYAQLSSSGVGPWSETTDYGAASGNTGSGGVVIDSNACVEDAGTIYCIGGTSTNYTVVSDVFSASLSPSGVGAWDENTDYGSNSTSNGSGGVPIYGTACVVYSPYVICVGGDTTGNAGTSHVFYGQDEKILGWKEAEGYIVSTYWDDCVEFDGYVYCWGQDDPNVYSAPIDTPSSTTSESSTSLTTSAPSSTISSSSSASGASQTSTVSSTTTTSPSTTTGSQGGGFPYVWLGLVAVLLIAAILAYVFLKGGGVVLAGDKGDDDSSGEAAKKLAKDKLKDYAKDKLKDWVKDQLTSHWEDYIPTGVSAPATFVKGALSLLAEVGSVDDAYGKITGDIHSKIVDLKDPDVSVIVSNNIKFDKKDTTRSLILLVSLRFRAKRLRALADAVKTGAIKPTETGELGFGKLSANVDISERLETEATAVDQAADQVNSSLSEQLKEK